MSKILHFKLDAVTNDQVTDLSGNGYDGTIQGGVTVVNDATFGTCLDFNGTDGSIVLDDTVVTPVLVQNSFTVTAWVYLDSSSGDNTILGSLQGVNNNSIHLVIRNGNPHLGFYGNDTQHPTVLNTGQWYHISWIYDYDAANNTGSQIMYINGADLYEETGKAPLQGSPQLHIGRWAANGNFFDGKLYGLRIYNTALTRAGIQSIIHEDRVWTISRTAHPIDFDLYDKDTQNVLYIEDTSDQLLTLHIENAAAETIQLTDLTANDVSDSNYHFALRFRPGTLSPVSLGEDTGNSEIQLATASAVNWQMLLSPADPSGMDVIYLRSNDTNFSLNPEDRHSLVFNNVGADGDQGARGTRVELLYTNMHYSGGTETVTGNREIHMSVINHRGKQNLPLHVGFVGDNGVLNDGTTQNALTLRFSNTLMHNTLNTDVSSLTFSHNADTTLRSKIILSFDAGTATDEWALATEAQIRSITISPLTGWTIIEPVQGESPEWILYPDTEDQVLYGKYAPDPNNANAFLPDYFELQFGTIDPGTGEITNGIITGFPTGHTHLHIRYENIPNYWDGQMKVAIEKRPLVYSSGNVGIDTADPSEKLHVSNGKIRLEGAFDTYLSVQETGSAAESRFWTHTDGELYIQNSNGIHFAGINNSSRYVSILNDGNVGIGTTNPGEQLEVNGNIYCTGDISMDGSCLMADFSVNGNCLFGEHEYAVANAPITVVKDTSSNPTLASFRSNTSNAGIKIRGLRNDTETASYIDFDIEGGGVFTMARIGAGKEVQNNAGANGQLRFYTNNNGTLSEAMRIGQNGNVGIGTTDPQAKLEVIGTGNRTLSTYNYMNANQVAGPLGDPLYPQIDYYDGNSHIGYSIYASERIACIELNVYCDERIKKDTVRSNSGEDLETLLKIQITDYTYIDPVVHGSKPQKKVLGQQLAAVYPQAVDTGKREIVPDVMQHTASGDNGEIVLENHDLKPGERVQILYQEDGEDKVEIFSIQEVNANSFRVDIPAVAELFIYGREVDDFHLVDFDALSALNISATQELYKRIEALTAENKKKELQIQKLAKRLDTLEMKTS